MSLILRLLGKMLHVANADPPGLLRYDFYAAKDRVLARYGTRLANEVQLIRHMCWACGGTGRIEPGYGCRKCLGSGVYQQRFYELASYELGGYRFHRPLRSHYDGNLVPTITGKIKHPSYPYWRRNLLAYCVLFLFNRHAFKVRLWAKVEQTFGYRVLAMRARRFLRITREFWRDRVRLMLVYDGRYWESMWLEVLLCVNDGNGNFAGTVGAIRIGDSMSLEGPLTDWAEPCTEILLEVRWMGAYAPYGNMRLYGQSYRFTGFRDYVGNICWAKVELRSGDVLRLLNSLKASGEWTCEEAETSLYETFNDGAGVFTAKHLPRIAQREGMSVEEDFQFMFGG